MTYVKKPLMQLDFRVKRRALQSALATGNPDVLKQMIAAFRKKTGSDLDSMTFVRILDFYDGYLLSLGAGAPNDALRLLSDLAQRPDPALADLIPMAVKIAADIAKKQSGSDSQVARLVDVGLAANPNDIPLLLVRAQLNLEGRAIRSVRGKTFARSSC